MRLLLFIILSFFTYTIQAQVDSEQKSVEIPVIESEEGDIEQEVEEEGKPINNQGFIIPKDDNINGLTVPKQYQPTDLPKEEFSMFNKEKFGNPGELYEDRIKKHASYTEIRKEQQYRGNTTTQFFGDHKTTSENINIVYRDYGAFDGDHIRVFINGDVVKATVLLTPDYTGFKFKLVEGINKIDFYALDTGQVSPNTAEFQILDDDGSVISGNQWNLAKGVKASIIIVK
ncbi:hypothetical protein KO494_11805 [Lacinutrix sp. C3R15]|uniref:hypothetical protein n=1 Tax=Flavobacteriaceae TaxID=49546 RepID=UPI001C0815E8|nr:MULTISPECIES: hypothetical protein [Flavobacteriaceae]MBU2940222.1 hypothetical protein [Lacinutrix sp. C3R15]MDO6623540.1 hypothetical protein [Oceanihabitans sp. 1_MG-2023]